MPPAKNARPIGGFFGLELPDGSRGLRAMWGADDIRAAFVNASSAFANLLKALPDGAVWLPAYICAEFARAVPATRLRYYPLDAALSPRLDALAAARAGDIVVAVDYFGRRPARAFLDFVAARGDVLFVEDCAQALDTGAPAWGDWRLYSSRKLVGVPDGGLLVACSSRAKATAVAASVDAGGDGADLAKPQLARFADTDEVHNDIWHALNQAKEAAMPVADWRISRLSWSLLGLLDAERIARRRRDNFAVLAARLSDWAFLPETSPDFVPLGFPVRLPPDRRAKVRGFLHDRRIFPAVHWLDLPSPASDFAAEHALAQSLLTLPCDQRYDTEDMERVAAAFGQAV